MGLMSMLSGVGRLILPATELTRTMRGDRAATDRMDHEWRSAVLAQLGAEFAQPALSGFDRWVNGLNRLPRPALALGTLGLFVYAMADPVGFASRMQGLALVPEPLWWLLGAIVSFYFGARELHYMRAKAPRVSVEDVIEVQQAQERLNGLSQDAPLQALGGLWPWARPTKKPISKDVMHPDYNAALEDWLKANRL